MRDSTTWKAAGDPEAPTIGRYRCDARLGEGGAFETWRAQLAGLAGFERVFAIKILRQEIARRDPGAGQRFLNAAKQAGALKDERIAHVVETGVVAETHFQATEFIHGLDLSSFSEKAQAARKAGPGRRIDEDEWHRIVAYVGAEIAKALAAAHRAQPPVVHGGLSWGNVVITPRGGIKVLDFALHAAVPSGREPGEFSPKGDAHALGLLIAGLAVKNAAPGVELQSQLGSLPAPLGDILAQLLASDSQARPSADDAAVALARMFGETPPAAIGRSLSALVWRFTAGTKDTATSSGELIATGGDEGQETPTATATALMNELPTRVGEPVPDTSSSLMQAAPTRVGDEQDLAPLIAKSRRKDVKAELNRTASLPIVVDAWRAAFGDAPVDESNERTTVPMPVVPDTERSNTYAEAVVVDRHGAHPLGDGDGVISTADLIPLSDSAAVVITEDSMEAAPPPLPRKSPPAMPVPPPVPPSPPVAAETPVPPSFPVATDSELVTPTPVVVRTGRSSQRGMVIGAAVAAFVVGAGVVTIKTLSKKTTPAVAAATQPAGAPASLAPVPKAAPVPAAPAAAEPTAVPPAQAEPVAKASDPEAAPSLPGDVQIETTPAGAIVWIDGVEKGKTPLSLPLSAGAHRLVLARVGHQIHKAEIDPTKSPSLSHELVAVQAPASGESGVRVECETEGRYPVMIDDKETGRLCPSGRIPLPPGAYRVGIYLPGEDRAIVRDVTVGEKPRSLKFQH